ncbi:hypothetical protein BDB01DRAFT_716417 [Pilobolus umbonatus]|nr:hypothetical protein BDB01DRAFT_716417 [Pilobolus umbonatus]
MQPTQPSNEPLSHALGDNSEGGHSSFTNIYSPTAQRNPTDPSYNILTPNILAPNHIHLPGMIPLVPLNNWSNILDSRNLQNDQPSTLPDHPSDEELRILSTTTREAMEQRLQILESVQNQLFQSMQLLTQALSVIPSANDVAPTNSTNTPDTPSEPTIAESSSVNNKTTIEEVDDKVDNMSSRRREKMPERSIPSKNDTNDHSYFSE